mgnify:CR=1 FL=1
MTAIAERRTRRTVVGAVAALKPLVNVLQEEKKSVIMAPEGTRTVSPRLAPFKKGAFHLAMQAGVPMVPIVLHDAIDIAPKGVFVYRPGQVTVEVLPPVDTSDWTAATIDEHVAEVRHGADDVVHGIRCHRSAGATKKPGDTRPQGQSAEHQPQRHRQCRQTEGDVVACAPDAGSDCAICDVRHSGAVHPGRHSH